MRKHTQRSSEIYVLLYMLYIYMIYDIIPKWWFHGWSYVWQEFFSPLSSRFRWRGLFGSLRWALTRRCKQTSASVLALLPAATKQIERRSFVFLDLPLVGCVLLRFWEFFLVRPLVRKKWWRKEKAHFRFFTSHSAKDLGHWRCFEV